LKEELLRQMDVMCRSKLPHQTQSTYTSFKMHSYHSSEQYM
jgi:hypothetical protein